MNKPSPKDEMYSPAYPRNVGNPDGPLPAYLYEARIDALVAALRGVLDTVQEASPGHWLVRPLANARYNAAMTEARAALKGVDHD